MRNVLFFTSDAAVAEVISQVMQDFQDTTTVSLLRDAHECVANSRVEAIVVADNAEDGLTFVRDIAEDARYAHIPIVYIADDSNPAAVCQALETGATHYVVRPFDLLELDSMLSPKLALV